MLYCKINRQIYSNGEYSNAEVIITRLNIINGEVCIDKNSNNPNCEIVHSKRGIICEINFLNKVV